MSIQKITLLVVKLFRLFHRLLGIVRKNRLTIDLRLGTILQETSSGELFLGDYKLMFLRKKQERGVSEENLMNEMKAVVYGVFCWREGGEEG